VSSAAHTRQQFQTFLIFLDRASVYLADAK
jgi:hypothetical protein